MASIVDFAAVLDIPDGATKAEWSRVTSAYSAIWTDMERQFGSDIGDRISDYYRAGDDRDKSEAILEADPEIGEALDYKALAVMSDPSLAPYYSGIYQIRTYWEGVRDDEIERSLGADIWDLQTEYNRRRTAGESPQAYLAEHPEIRQINKIKDAYAPIIAQKVVEFGSHLREVPVATRDTEAASYGQEQIRAGLEGRETGLPQIPWSEWQQLLGPSLSRLVEDYAIDGTPIPDGMMGRIGAAGNQLGVGGGFYALEIAAMSARQ
jgi:hypothetical protein